MYEIRLIQEQFDNPIKMMILIYYNLVNEEKVIGYMELWNI